MMVGSRCSSPMSTAIYTCITGSYNDLQPHPEIEDVDWIAFLDAPSDRTDWKIRSFPPQAVLY